MSNYKPIVDIFGEICDKIRLEYDPIIAPVVGPPAVPGSGGKKPYYLYGHPLEIMKILSEKSANDTLKFEKYPLIVLFQDFKEGITLTGRDVPLNIAIITETRQDYTAAERYNDTFKNTIYPIWDLLIKYIKRSKYIDNKMELTYDKTDRLYWGKNNSNLFNDFIDAIEIENLKLQIKESC